MGEVKNKWGSNIYYVITTISLCHFLETANIQKSEVFLLQISLENVNA